VWYVYGLNVFRTGRQGLSTYFKEESQYFNVAGTFCFTKNIPDVPHSNFPYPSQIQAIVNPNNLPDGSERCNHCQHKEKTTVFFLFGLPTTVETTVDKDAVQI